MIKKWADEAESIRKVYRECSEDANFHYEMGIDEDPVVNYLRGRYEYEQYKYSTPSFYSKEEFIKMMLCARELTIKLGLKEIGIDWRRFKSPVEVVGLHALSKHYLPGQILINEKDSTGKYEIDLTPRDEYGNVIFLLDIQGGYHNDDEQKRQDEKKRQYFESQNVKFVQITGWELLNQYTNIADSFSPDIISLSIVGHDTHPSAGTETFH